MNTTQEEDGEPVIPAPQAVPSTIRDAIKYVAENPGCTRPNIISGALGRYSSAYGYTVITSLASEGYIKLTIVATRTLITLTDYGRACNERWQREA